MANFTSPAAPEAATVKACAPPSSQQQKRKSLPQRCAIACLPLRATVEDIARESGVDSRLGTLERVLGMHPSYLRVQLATNRTLMRGDGPLPRDWRHFVAMLATTRHGSRYLYERERRAFLSVGGDPLWLQGSVHLPRKLANLFDLNAVLAHRPWLLSHEHIEDLLRGDDASPPARQPSHSSLD